MKHQWVYRPTEKEHEKLLRAMAKNPEYTSVAQFVREAVMRLIYEGDRAKLFSDVGDVIEELGTSKEKFLNLVLKHSGDSDL